MNIKKFLNLIYLILILANIVILLCLLISDKEDNKDSFVTQTKINSTSIEFDYKIKPEYFQKFESMYNGNMNKDDIYNGIYKLLTNMHVIYYDVEFLNEDDLVEYYIKNEEVLKNKYNIHNYEDYINLLNELKKIYRSGRTYYSTVKFNLESYKNVNETVECSLLIIFDNGTELSIKMIIKNDSEMIFKPIIEE